MKYTGQSVPRVDVRAKVKGEAIFASGRVMPGQAYLKILMAHRPHAIVKRVLTPGLSTYLVPTVVDIPHEMNIMVLEIPDPRGPWGARGLGEVMNMCLAPAVTSAVHDATGVWFDHFALVPDEVLTGIATAREK